MRCALGLLVLVWLARPAAACGVPDFSAYARAIGEAFAEDKQPIESPEVIVGVGTGTEGGVLVGALGYAWGERDTGLFGGSSVSRVLVHARMHAEQVAVAATYGWYQDHLVSTGFDVGVESRISDTLVGPTARVTVGLGGLGLQLTGSALYGGPKVDVVGGASLVVDLMDVAGRI